MKEVLTRWYQRYLSEEEAVILLVMLAMAFAVMLSFGDILAPGLVAIVLAYLMQGGANVLRQRGLPGEPDFAAAAHWYAKAAEQGMRLAAFRLALIYQLGRGVPRNPVLAAKWYTKAAEEGLAEAQFNLGYLYERGIGVPVDGKSSVSVPSRGHSRGARGISASRYALCRRPVCRTG